jgi:nucleoside-diphosphate-sugar epimerase
MLAVAALLMPAGVASLRVAVWGGSGFIGSRVCRALAEDGGCDVVSISRAGRPPAWAAGAPWTARVEWLAGDGADADAAAPAALGRVDAAVSCVGNVRPAPTWSGFFGLHWDDTAMRRENGAVNACIAAAAKRAGARA